MGKKKHCKVQSCESYLEKGMFGFPKENSLKKLWLEALNIDSHAIGDKVCIKHFREKYDYCKMGTGNRFKLAYDAVPNLYLPEKSHVSNSKGLHEISKCVVENEDNLDQKLMEKVIIIIFFAINLLLLTKTLLI